ncbi:hypothetical protein BDB00DRAFT_530946 [Zychaea mexicana]|uniref:uncharacterized protein n=1 Tax=Zychaea mexicana TaxID=64656 RepID=UPI0022FE18E0|nr:uncharacterized protein BDB00DRAFT_530946 [Zychaea mexicana]KAI9490830.1 hypothetical protein BDB00DRAFT_530946 [Zychaea mexicana]
MSDNSDDEYEEETVHMVVDLGSEIAPELLERLARENSEMTYLATEDGEQFIQLGGITFRGQLNETVCTNLLFEVHERKREGSGLLPILSSIKKEGEENDETRARRQQLPSHSELTLSVMTDNVTMCERVTLLEKKGKQNTSVDTTNTPSATPPQPGKAENYGVLLAEHTD